ncbi:MAG: GH92 family glycosyl hydrolase [Muribaculaceae bacterium]|nr:GH92 family glycosyl hydrolase [Muribaculaceae bacterium]
MKNTDLRFSGHIRATVASIAAATLVAAVSCSSAETGSQTGDLASEVNPMIGTDFTGNTYPGAQAPFGMVQLSPDNGLPGWDRISGYYYPDSTIAGFSHTHLSGTGAGDLYDISFMPVTFPVKEAPAPLGIHSLFSHDSEHARAGYYKVRLDDYGIDVELTATERVGLQRYTMPGGKAAVLLNLSKAMNWDAVTDASIEIIDSVTVAGHRFSDGWARDQKVWFVSRFSVPFDSVSVSDTIIDRDGAPASVAQDAAFYFNTTAGQQITVATALSVTSVDNAMANLEAEAPDVDFDKAEAATRKAWNEALGSIRVTTPDSTLRRIFYTALYHSMLAPTIYCDTDGSYPGPDGKIHKADGFTNYSSFSTWDTYRASHPLYTIIAPDRAADMARSLIEFGVQNGRLPVWNMWGSETDMMIGYHSAPIITEAILKNTGVTDAEKALDIMVKTARMRDYRQLGDYIDLGFVPVQEGQNWEMSKTLEYAYDDYAIAMLAKHLGRNDIHDEFMARAGNYANTYNPASGFFQPRLRDGSFVEPFNPDEYTEEICESNAWQYLFSVQHDIDGMTRLFGGRKELENKLDSMVSHQTDPSVELPIFSTGMIGQYAHGNEPSHHNPYLYNYTDSPWKGADWLRRIMTELYTDSPDGLPGNEDMGQMSAWYVFSALGFYPLNPVSGLYELGAPMFEEAEICLPGGKTFTVKAKGLSEGKRYIASATLDGKPLEQPRISHSDIMDGGVLELQMTSEQTNPWKKTP